MIRVLNTNKKIQERRDDMQEILYYEPDQAEHPFLNLLAVNSSYQYHIFTDLKELLLRVVKNQYNIFAVMLNFSDLNNEGKTLSEVLSLLTPLQQLEGNIPTVISVTDQEVNDIFQIGCLTVFKCYHNALLCPVLQRIQDLCQKRRKDDTQEKPHIPDEKEILAKQILLQNQKNKAIYQIQVQQGKPYLLLPEEEIAKEVSKIAIMDSTAGELILDMNNLQYTSIANIVKKMFCDSSNIPMILGEVKKISFFLNGMKLTVTEEMSVPDILQICHPKIA